MEALEPFFVPARPMPWHGGSRAYGCRAQNNPGWGTSPLQGAHTPSHNLETPVKAYCRTLYGGVTEVPKGNPTMTQGEQENYTHMEPSARVPDLWGNDDNHCTTHIQNNQSLIKVGGKI